MTIRGGKGRNHKRGESLRVKSDGNEFGRPQKHWMVVWNGMGQVDMRSPLGKLILPKRLGGTYPSGVVLILRSSTNSAHGKVPERIDRSPWCIVTSDTKYTYRPMGAYLRAFQDTQHLFSSLTFLWPAYLSSWLSHRLQKRLHIFLFSFLLLIIFLFSSFYSQPSPLPLFWTDSLHFFSHFFFCSYFILNPFSAACLCYQFLSLRLGIFPTALPLTLALSQHLHSSQRYYHRHHPFSFLPPPPLPYFS